ncbi:hypothetical protein KSP40_PGU021767 [Platanthera guangdongensis]|uniref:Transcription initiation factor TFIID subunit 13 n=1 Tax=Platanthera guangdongensis TaxID=2320717 RepID=A0ABR2LUU6_9ASPA
MRATWMISPVVLLCLTRPSRLMSYSIYSKNRHPLPESVALLEDIVVEYVTDLNQACRSQSLKKPNEKNVVKQELQSEKIDTGTCHCWKLSLLERMVLEKRNGAGTSCLDRRSLMNGAESARTSRLRDNEHDWERKQDPTKGIMSGYGIVSAGGIVHKAQDISSRRGKLLTEDFLYLIRKDPPKLRRSTELLSMNEELKQARKAFEVDEEKLASTD